MIMLAVILTTSSLMYAQNVGTPNGNTSFFNTNAQGKLLGHRQAGTFGAFGTNDRWIGIGQPISSAYGIRLQANGNAGILALTGTGSNKKLELNWSGPGKTADFEINQITSFTNPSGKINRFTIKTSGKVGIGTTNPTRKFQVNVAGRDGLRLQGNNGGDVIFEINNGGGIHYIFDDDSNAHALDVESANDLAFNTNGSYERMRIKESGKVGIGTTNPTRKFQVNVAGRDGLRLQGNNGGDVIFEINNGGGIHYIFDDDSNAHALDVESANDLAFNTNGPYERMRIKENGNVGIGRTNPAYKIDVNGSARVTTMFVSSDERFKKDIRSIDNASDKINALNGFTYKFNNNKIGEYDFSKITQEKQLGFMAQDVQKVFPELVSTDEDGYLSVNYIGLIPVLVEALKEQKEVVTEQKEEIADLQTRMAKLEALLNASETIQGNLSTPTESTVEGVVLRQNAPNPFNGSTTIEYQLPERLASATLVVSDLNGRTISTYTISGKGNIQFDANNLDNGIYTYAIIANGQSIATQKMVIQK